MQATHTTPPQPGRFIPNSTIKTIYSVSILIGILAFAAGLLKDEQRIWFSFLVSFFYFICLGLGGLFFAALNHMTSAGWSVNIRRITESLTAFLPIGAIAAVVLLFGAKKIYIWLDPEIVKHDAVIAVKHAYLNFGALLTRLVVFIGMWLIFSKVIVGNSIKQDETGDEQLTIKNKAVSVAFILLFALSFSLFTVDTLMSLEPHWYSTIFGVYCFAGLFQSSLAVITIITVYLVNKGLLRGLVSDHHLHDMGKYMMAFTVFYAYIAFSQFMLIWYANLPEETIFYLNRANGGWLLISWSLLIFKFIVPFLLLLPKWAKRNHAQLVMVAIIILIMQFVDIYWLVYPNLDNNQVLFGWQEVGIFIGFLGLFIMSVTRFLSKNNLVPIKDPRIQESIHHEVVY
jgi:hypothetical protein